MDHHPQSVIMHSWYLQILNKFPISWAAEIQLKLCFRIQPLPTIFSHFPSIFQNMESINSATKGTTEDEMAGWHHWLDGRWVWVNSGSWWWTGRPGMLQFMGLQRVGHNWVTELNWFCKAHKHIWCDTHYVQAITRYKVWI